MPLLPILVFMRQNFCWSTNLTRSSTLSLRSAFGSRFFAVYGSAGLSDGGLALEKDILNVVLEKFLVVFEDWF